MSNEQNELVYERTERGFEIVQKPTYANEPKMADLVRVIQQSSAIGDYPDSMDKPGSSYLWVGPDHHLNRSEVRELATRMLAWAQTGSLELPSDKESESDEDVDWTYANQAREQMEAAGLHPILCLTVEDVRDTLMRDVSKSGAEDILDRVAHKAEWDWPEVVRAFGEDTEPDAPEREEE